MTVSDRGKRERRLALGRKDLFIGTILASCGWLVQPASAQSIPTVAAPAVRPASDANGVDVISGALNYSHVDATIGTAESGLQFIRSWEGNGWRYNILATLDASGSTYKVSIGGKSETFTLSNGSFIPDQGQGSKLTNNGGSYHYTAADGTLVIFSPTNAKNPYGSAPDYYGNISSVSPGGFSFPSGEVWTPGTYNYQTSSGTYLERLDSIQSTNGFAIKLGYASDTATDLQHAAAFYTITSVRLYNGAVDYCPPNAPISSCVFTQSWPTITDTDDGTTETVGTPAGTWTYGKSGGALVSISPPGAAANAITSIGYSGGKVSSFSSGGIAYSYGYSDSGNTRTTTVTGPSGTRTITSDSSLSLIKSDQNALGQVSRYIYDGVGRLTHKVFPEGSVDGNGNPTADYVKYSYDGRGNITEERRVSKTPGNPPDIVLTSNYSATCDVAVNCNKPTSTIDARRNQTDYTYDPTHGGVLTVTRPAGSNGVRPVTNYGYTVVYGHYKNSYGAMSGDSTIVYKQTSVSTCLSTASCAGTSDERKTTTSYGPQSSGVGNNLLPVSVTIASGDGSISSTTAVTYDNVGNVIAKDGPLPGTADTTQYRYDGARRLIGVVNPDPDGTGPRMPAATRITYNADGSVNQRETGTVTDQSDASWANFASSTQQVTSYDTAGRPVRVEDRANGWTFQVTQQNYDASGRVACTVVRMDPAQWANQPDACVAQTNGTFGPDRVVHKTYDAIDRILSSTDGYGSASPVTQSVGYNPNGTTAYVIDQNNNRTDFSYDGFDRLATTTYPGGSFERLQHDENGNVISRLLRDGQTLSYGYDALNRLVSKTVPSGVYWETSKTYGYDLVGDLTSASDSNGRTLGFGYNVQGDRLSQTDNWYNFGNAQYQYDVAGRRTRTTWADGFYVTYDYDTLGEMTAIHENGGFVLASFGYDDLGRRTSLSRGNGTSTSYGYDAASRLTSLSQSLVGTSANQSFTYGYNPAGQITSRTASNDAYAWNGAYNVDRSYGVNGLNQYTSAGGTTFGYDGRGNLTNSGGTTYGYTSENRMATTPGANLAYDPLDRLFNINAENGVNTTLLYDGADLIAETDQNNGALLRRYIQGPGIDEPIVWYEGSGTNDRRWLHADERGSVIAVSDSAGNASAINTYDEQGIPGASNSGRFQYTGQKWLPSVGLYDYKARMYSPTLGRFMQTDPIGYGDGLNWYNYAHSDPVNATDPSGLGDCDSIKDNEARDICYSTTPITVTGHRPIPYHGPPSNPNNMFTSFHGSNTSAGVGGGVPAPGGGGSRGVNCSSPAISPAEAAAAARGDRSSFWNSRAARGDPLGATALSIVNNSTVSGQYANVRLRDAISSRSPGMSSTAISAEVQQIGVQLMQAQVSAVNTLGSPLPPDIAAYHFQIFAQHGLPALTFGGAMMTGSWLEAELTSPSWFRCH